MPVSDQLVQAARYLRLTEVRLLAGNLFVFRNTGAVIDELLNRS